MYYENAGRLLHKGAQVMIMQSLFEGILIGLCCIAIVAVVIVGVFNKDKED